MLNADDARAEGMAARTRARVLTYGLSPSADVRAIDVKLDAQGRLGFRLVARGAEARVRLRMHGEHQVGDVLASVAVGLGYPLDAVAQALSDAEALSRDACTDARRSRTRAASHPGLAVRRMFRPRGPG
ncbi:Mur ligase family protein [Micromonospora sp. NBC_01796]|uniref:Mur ligase family protein n=1 Tax=Micromonospora sp. NBC_01796 TaxID=2975987 RepID=UPI002DDC0CCC|nr:Mur ligase family protein [Micromonospora sp. NBC_01796]WSA86024.1 Mur ligase family protein [Micromonospora sp. NBC_01796]